MYGLVAPRIGEKDPSAPQVEPLTDALARSRTVPEIPDSLSVPLDQLISMLLRLDVPLR